MWGTNVPTHAVIVVVLDTIADGALATVEGETLITEHLAQALQQRRHASQPTTLWADQVCIDQQNIPERGAQVRIMNVIFEKAHRVHCWLGLEPFGVSDGMAAWKKLKDIVLYVEQCFKAAGPSLRNDVDDPSEFINIYDSAILGPYGDIADIQTWEAILLLFRNSWWHRAWIMPEISGQKELYILFHGSLLGMWNMCLALYLVLARLGNEVLEGHCFTIYLEFFELLVSAQLRAQNLIKVAAMRNMTAGGPLMLQMFLQAARESLATNPRDKVYVAIACMNDVHDNLLLVPDYSLSIRTVYGRVVEYMNRALNNLGIISLAQPSSPELLTDLPSWMPDWRTSLLFPLNMSVVDLQALYSASGGTQAEIWIDKDYVELKLTAISIDTVSVVVDGSTLFYSQLMVVSMPVIREWYNTVLSILGNLYRNGIPVLDAFCITMTMDCRITERTRGHTIPTSFATIEPDEISEFMKEGFDLLLARFHRFGISQDKYMGLYPLATRPGDKIFILLDGSMPAVLRPVDGGYKLIGFAYAHGLMDGEAMAGLENGMYKLERITLL
ncbi:hypothetical protein MMC34_007745 [Xylographa carneopallida]|nr:hypothetical protein [Xylographa carneopallida]